MAKMIAICMFILLLGASGCLQRSEQTEQDPPIKIYVQYLAVCDSCQSLELIYSTPDEASLNSSKPQHRVSTLDFLGDEISNETLGPNYNGANYQKIWKQFMDEGVRITF